MTPKLTPRFPDAPGSSLGGARPKASVIEKDGHLAIAKFPRKDDEINTVVWEAVAFALAQKSGIAVPESRVETISKKTRPPAAPLLTARASAAFPSSPP